MRIAVSISLLAVITLTACQSTGDDADGVPASAVPTAMEATATTMGGAPEDLADLVNAPATSPQNQMKSRGYSFTQQQGSTTYWWNPRTTICATTVTGNGKFQTIGTSTARYCGQQ
jgi:hypothetical protein